MDDNIVEDMCDEFDVAFTEWAMKYQLTPMFLSALVLARLTRLAKECGFAEEFLKLLDSPRQNLSKEDKDVKPLIH